MILVVAAIRLLLLSALWWMRLRGLCKLPDGKNWQWEKLGLALVGRALLSKALIQLSAKGLGCIPSLIVVWPEGTQARVYGLYGRVNGDLQEGVHQAGLSQPAAAIAAVPVMIPCQTMHPQEALQH